MSNLVYEANFRTFSKCVFAEPPEPPGPPYTFNCNGCLRKTLKIFQGAHSLPWLLHQGVQFLARFWVKWVGDRAESAQKTFLVSFTYRHELLIQTEENSNGSKGESFIGLSNYISKGPSILLLVFTTFPILSSDWFPRNFTESLTAVAVQCPLKGQWSHFSWPSSVSYSGFFLLLFSSFFTA